MSVWRPFRSLLMLAVLALSLGRQAETHLHGHCAAASAVPASDHGARHAHAAGPEASHQQHAMALMGSGPETAAGAAPHAGAAATTPAALAAPMADCEHCTGGGCEMTTGCSSSGTPVSGAASALRAATESAAARPIRPLAAWRSASLDPPTPPPNRLG